MLFKQTIHLYFFVKGLGCAYDGYVHRLCSSIVDYAVADIALSKMIPHEDNKN